MIRHTNYPSAKLWIGIQRKNNSYTFLHWLDHNSETSRFKYLKYNRVLKEHKSIGPTSLVEWLDD